MIPGRFWVRAIRVAVGSRALVGGRRKLLLIGALVLAEQFVSVGEMLAATLASIADPDQSLRRRISRVIVIAANGSSRLATVTTINSGPSSV